MVKQANVVDDKAASIDIQKLKRAPGQSISRGVAICTAFFVLSILISLAPLKRYTGVDSLLKLPTNELLTLPGSWLPVDLHFPAASTALSEWTTHAVLFMTFIWLAFILYLIACYLLARQPITGDYHQMRRLIWSVTIGLGVVFMLTPAMLSHDIFVYAGYGRILTIYHTNPYVITLSTFPHDAFLRLDDWRDAPSAYGPIWLAICGIVALIGGDDPGRTLLIYRALALGTHLLNMLLITRILQAQNRSPRTVTLGLLLYAWNPLVLEESSLGGHNDVLMVTLILFGIFLDLRLSSLRERSKRQPLRAYLPTVIAFTLALLIKFTSAPVMALYFVLLVRRAFGAEMTQLWRRIKAVALLVIPAGLLSGVILIAIYLPYWIGFTPDLIISTFTSPPSAQSSYGSIHYAIVAWNRVHPLPPTGTFAYFIMTTFSQHSLWNIIDIATLACLLIVGVIWIWRSPSMRTLILASVATLGAVLVVTFWFYPWYLTWIVGLVVLALPVKQQRIARALLASTIIFAASSLASYLYAYYLSPIGDWSGWCFLTTLAPPLLTLLLFLFLPTRHDSDQPPTTMLSLEAESKKLQEQQG